VGRLWLCIGATLWLALPACHGKAVAPADGAAPPGSGPRVADLVGLNGFIDDPTDKLAAVGNVREYHNWSWNEGNGAAGYPGYPNDALEYSLFGGAWDWDAYYGSLRQAGVSPLPCVEGSVDYLGNAMPPVPTGADAADPASYVAHASFLYQLAARYGGRAVPSSTLKLAAGQTARTGLGLLDSYEDGNEPDANWVKADGSQLFSPEQAAAMMSADYDGHEGKLGATFGVKQADPGAQLVMPGLAGAGSGDWLTNVTAYLEGIRAWGSAHRSDRAFPADVINVHYYCFGPDAFGVADPRPGLSPEACGLEALLAKVVLYRDQHLPGKPIWLTELGYDTHPRSRLRAPAIGATPAEVVQGQWLVRSFLAVMAAGVDRAFIFVSRDGCTGSDSQCPDNHIQFSTSGVLTQKGEENAKPAWYYLATVRARLGAMRSVGKMDSGTPGVTIARFFDGAQSRGAYVLWSPTADDSSTAAYALHVADGIDSATLVSLQDGSSTGSETPAPISGGTVTLTVSETPTLVLVNGAP
jgi:hypothetical protein